MVNKIIYKVKLILAVFGIVILLFGMHDVDIAWNAKIINIYSEVLVDMGSCKLQFPKLWDGDYFPNGHLIEIRELYLLGVSLEVFGILLLLASVIL